MERTKLKLWKSKEVKLAKKRKSRELLGEISDAHTIVNAAEKLKNADILLGTHSGEANAERRIGTSRYYRVCICRMSQPVEPYNNRAKMCDSLIIIPAGGLPYSLGTES